MLSTIDYRQPDYNLAICIPCGDNLKTNFSYSLLQLQKSLLKDNIKNHIFFEKGSLLPSQRETLVNKAINKKCNYILWLDSDMIFPMDIFKRLVQHDKDIVACNYLTRDGENLTTSFIKKENSVKRIPLNETELIESDACGMGIMLMKTKIFEILPKPRFQFSWNNEFEYHNGEDIYFCCLAKDYGYKIWIDGNSSKLVGHIGETIYK